MLLGTKKAFLLILCFSFEVNFSFQLFSVWWLFYPKSVTHRKGEAGQNSFFLLQDFYYRKLSIVGHFESIEHKNMNWHANSKQPILNLGGGSTNRTDIRTHKRPTILCLLYDTNVSPTRRSSLKTPSRHSSRCNKAVLHCNPVLYTNDVLYSEIVILHY